MTRSWGTTLGFALLCLTGCASMMGQAGLEGKSPAQKPATEMAANGPSDMIWWQEPRSSETLWWSGSKTTPSDLIWWSDARPSQTLWWDSSPSKAPLVATPTE